MRVAVDHAVMAERVPPGAEHGAGDLVALFERPVAIVQQPLAVEPGHGEQPLGGELSDHLRHADERIGLEDEPIEPHVAGLEIVVELLAEPRRDLLQHLRGLDGRAHAGVDGEEDAKLDEIGLHGRLHVGILQLGGKRPPIMALGAMHLAERGRGRGFMREACELGFPLWPKLRRHAAPHEGPAHGRRLALQLTELCGIFGRQRLGDGGKQLRHLHDWALQPAKGGGERGRILVAFGVAPEQAPAGDARRHPADIGADGGIAHGARGEPVLLLVGWAVVHGRCDNFTLG